jgi:hypothetical protein
MKGNENRTRINTNSGELIAAVSSVVFENSNDPEEAYEAYMVAHLVLMEMSKKASFNNVIDTARSANSHLHLPGKIGKHRDQ